MIIKFFEASDVPARLQLSNFSKKQNADIRQGAALYTIAVNAGLQQQLDAS